MMNVLSGDAKTLLMNARLYITMPLFCLFFTLCLVEGEYGYFQGKYRLHLYIKFHRKKYLSIKKRCYCVLKLNKMMHRKIIHQVL